MDRRAAEDKRQFQSSEETGSLGSEWSWNACCLQAVSIESQASRLTLISGRVCFVFCTNLYKVWDILCRFVWFPSNLNSYV